MLRDVVIAGRTRPSSMLLAIFTISMHACDPVPIVLGLCLAALWAAGALLSSQLHYMYTTHFALMKG